MLTGLVLSALHGGAGAAPSQAPDEAAAHAAAAAVQPSVGLVQVGRRFGTGWVAAPGIVVTNAHVAEVLGSSAIFSPSTGGSAACRIIGMADRLDIAALACQGLAEPPLRLADEDPAVGSAVAVVGFPGGRGPVITTGRVTELEQHTHGWGRLAYSALIQPGNSGSPVVDERGRVVSIATFGNDRGSAGSRVHEIRFLLIDVEAMEPRPTDGWLALLRRRALLPVLGAAALGALWGRRSASGSAAGRAVGLALLTGVLILGYSYIEYLWIGPALLYT